MNRFDYWINLREELSDAEQELQKPLAYEPPPKPINHTFMPNFIGFYNHNIGKWDEVEDAMRNGMVRSYVELVQKKMKQMWPLNGKTMAQLARRLFKRVKEVDNFHGYEKSWKSGGEEPLPASLPHEGPAEPTDNYRGPRYGPPPKHHSSSWSMAAVAPPAKTNKQPAWHQMQEKPTVESLNERIQQLENRLEVAEGLIKKLVANAPIPRGE